MTMADSRLHDQPLIPKLEKRIRELEAQLEEAERDYQTMRNLFDSNPNAWYSRVEAAEARAEAMRKALEKVEKYFASEESPLYSLWENGDICSWDDNPREKWEHVLEDLGDLENFQMTELDIGMGVKWQAVAIYRTILAALKKGKANEY